MTLISRHSACALALSATLVAGFAAAQSRPSVGAGADRRDLKVELSQPGQAASAHGPDLQKQRELLALIQSDAPKGQKAVACKLLTIHGTDEAIPVLAPLLSDPQLASWARIALEGNPSPVALAALRDAMAKLDGNLLIGVINSLGERRDEKAIGALATRLEDANPDIASAAAVALGKIGGSTSAKHLQRSLAKAPETIRPAVAEGCVRCAENFLADGKDSAAQELYDAVREGRVPRNKKMEATRGAILARGDRGIPMLLEELRATEKDRFSVGLRTARELPGRKATEAIAAEVGSCPAARQPMIFLALADRRDPAALPTVMQAAKTGSKELRLVAVTVLERLGTLASVPVLVDVATSPDAGLSQAALNALTRLTADGVEADLVSRLSKSSGREREILIRVAGQRRLVGGLGQILSSAEHPDAGVRSAALQALGSIGGDAQIPGLVRLLGRVQDPKSRGEVETALLAVSGRVPSSVKYMAPLARSTDAGTRSLALRCLSASGGPEALAVVKSAIADNQDPELQDEAVRVLVTWPNTWPDDEAVAEPLLTLARSGSKKTHQVLALRGYLQFIQGDTKLKPEDKVQKVGEVMSLMQRPEEKRQAISVLGDLAAPAAIEMLLSMAGDEAIREDACSALLKLGSRSTSGLPKEQRQKALQAVLDKSQTDANKKRAEERIKAL